MAVDAQTLRAGRAAIELAIAGDTLDPELASIRKKTLDSFKQLSADVAKIRIAPNAVKGSGGFLAGMVGGVAAGAGRIWSGVKNSFAAIGIHAARLKASLATINSYRFTNLLSLRNLFVGAGILGLVGWPVKLAANLELSGKQMGVFAGDADKARTMLLDLLKFSAVGFQDLNVLITQTRLLMTYGLSTSEATADIKALAVVAAGSTEQFQALTLAYGQVKSATRLTGEEIRQFKNTAFNPLVEISRKTGESVDDVRTRMEAGGVTFEEVRGSLHRLVREGGRFNGMLNVISTTLIGKLKRAMAGIKVAVLPLGDEMLAPFKKFMDVLIGMLPAISGFIDQNKGLINTVLKAAGIVAAVATGFLAFKLVMTVVGLAVSGVSAAVSILVATFGTVSAIVGILTSPWTILIALLGAVSVAFLRMTETGRAVANSLSNWFNQMAGIVSGAWQGIVDAIKAGELGLAGKIAMVGFETAIFAGLSPIAKAFDGMVSGLVKVFGSGIGQILKLWKAGTKEIANWLLRDAAAGGFMGTAALIGTGVDLNEIQRRNKEMRGTTRNELENELKKRQQNLAGVEARLAEMTSWGGADARNRPAFQERADFLKKRIGQIQSQLAVMDETGVNSTGAIAIAERRVARWQDISDALTEGGERWQAAIAEYGLGPDEQTSEYVNRNLADAKANLQNLSSETVDVLGDMQSDADKVVDAMAAKIEAFLDNPNLGERTKEKMAALKAELEELRKKTKELSLVHGGNKDWLGPMPDVGAGAAASLKKAKGNVQRPAPTFDTRLVQQIYGGPANEQVNQLRQINRKVNSWGLTKQEMVKVHARLRQIAHNTKTAKLAVLQVH